MTVRAKFFVQNVSPSFEDQPEAVSRQITMGAVCRGAANREWASATPGGSVQMTVRNEVASAYFERGKEYYLTFEEAEPAPVPGDGHQAEPGPTAWGALACERCGMAGSWVKHPTEAGQFHGVWDEDAQARHDQAYGKPE